MYCYESNIWLNEGNLKNCDTVIYITNKLAVECDVIYSFCKFKPILRVKTPQGGLIECNQPKIDSISGCINIETFPSPSTATAQSSLTSRLNNLSNDSGQTRYLKTRPFAASTASNSSPRQTSATQTTRLFSKITISAKNLAITNKTVSSSNAIAVVPITLSIGAVIGFIWYNYKYILYSPLILKKRKKTINNDRT